MCLLLLSLLLGPRVIAVIWWLVDQVRWAATFDNILLPIVGILIVPWTTIMYVLVAPQGLDLVDWLFLGLALLADIGGFAGGALKGRNQMTASPGGPPPGPPMSPP